MKNKFLFVSVILMSLIFGGVIHAEVAATPEKPHVKKPGPCKDDIAKHCKDVEKGGGKIVACLKEHQGDLTSECKISMDSREKMKAFRDACATELKTYCPKKEGEKKPHLKRAIFDCLEKYESKLSSSCKEKFDAAKPPVEADGGVH